MEVEKMGKNKRAKRPCLVPSCKGFADQHGYCSAHQDKVKKQDRRRGTAHERGYTSKWDKARKEFLDSNPLCTHCLDRDYINGATVVDHIVPHKGDEVLFWDKTNWQPLCKPCHDRKTATEDMGAWSPVEKTKKPEVSVNNFKPHDWVRAVTSTALETLECKPTDRFLITAVCDKSIEVTDADHWVHRLHFSHFELIEHE